MPPHRLSLHHCRFRRMPFTSAFLSVQFSRLYRPPDSAPSFICLQLSHANTLHLRQHPTQYLASRRTMLHRHQHYPQPPHHRTPSSSGKENNTVNTPPPRPHMRKPPSTDPAHHLHTPLLVSTSPIPHLKAFLRRYADLAENAAQDNDLLSTTAHPNLLPSMRAAVETRHPSLLRIIALLFTRLAAIRQSAEQLSSPPYLSLIQAALEGPPKIPKLCPRDVLSARDASRLAARAVRNMAAFSTDNAVSIARNSSIIHLLILHLSDSLQSSSASRDPVEFVAALANFARCGIIFQAYLKKHDVLTALSEAAHQPDYPPVKFHACRALAEFSLNHKWLVLLIADGCVNIMLTIISQESDHEILSEATRFLGNLATSKIGREAIIGSDGISRVVPRLLSSSYHQSKPESKHLTIDLLRTTSNLCVNSKEAVRKTIKLGGVMAFVDAHTGSSDEQLQTEAFRGLLILAQAGQKSRASVLREIGIKIRHHASLGHCVADLYDLSRRIKVEASTERNDDFPQTIAALGARSKDYLFQAGPLATESSNPPNSVPDLKSPNAGAFRQSGRLLSVQRPMLHRDRLELERRHRSPIPSSPMSPPPHGSPRSNQHQQRRPRTEKPVPSASMHDGAAPRGHSSDGSSLRRVVSQPADMDHIPRCRVVEGKDKEDNSSGNWVLAVWSAVCNAVTRPPNSGPIDSTAYSSTVGSSSTSVVSDNGEDVYEIGVPLGRGGFATVFLAKNLRTGELVAVKRFHPVPASTKEAQKKVELAARRAIKEQRIWDGLVHKNIVSYRGCFFGENAELNLVAEYIPGWSLADHLAQISKFPEHMVACVTAQIVDGLDYLHKCGVTHRDVKPANILVNPDGIIKITDFGVSSAVDVPTMTGNTLVGTPWYIAPEMILGKPYGKSVDVWSLGCTVLELATGRRPYHNLRAHVALFRMSQDRMPPIPKKLSPVLRDFLKTCWVWDPAHRPTPSHLRRHPFLASVTRPEVTNLKNMTRKA